MENLPTPLSRVELYLAKACGMDVTVSEQPIGRLEQFLAILAGNTSITMPTPIGLTEQWLAYVLGVTPDPLLAVEGACLIGAQKVDVRYFAVAASMPGATLPEAPQNRAEMYWAHIAVNPPTPGILKYVTGKYFNLTDVVSGIEELQYVKGDTYQQTYSGKNIINNANLAYDYSNVSGSTNELSSLSTGIRYKSTYSGTGNPSVVFKIMDLTGLEGKTIRMVSTFTSGGRIRISQTNEAVSSRDTVATTTTSNQTISWVVPNDLGDNHYLGFTLVGVSDATIDFENLIMTIDNADMNYEPYTGGPAPNPDYPQAVQVVTGEQMVEVSNGDTSQTYPISLTGKNLLDLTTFENGYINSSGTVSSGGGTNAVFGFMPVLPETEYTVSVQNNSFAMAIAYYDSNKTLISRITNDYVARTSRTFTTPQNCAYARAGFYANSGASQSIMENSLPQFEIGSSASSYAPYYNYELCKLGDYQDYIYKSGDDWYVHKEIGKLTASSSQGWGYNAGGAGLNNPRFYLLNVDAKSGTFSEDSPIMTMSNCLNGSTWYRIYRGESNNLVSTGDQSNLRRLYVQVKTFTSLQDWEDFIDSNDVYIYYVLEAAVNVQITDATLISQLEALNSAQLPKPIANITVSATGTNLTPYLTIAYYGSDEE